MDNPTQLFDVIIVGAGVMGSATAYYSTKLGLRTLLLEQFDFLHHRGSSHGESRTIRATYPEPYYPSMALQASLLWEQAQSEAGYKVYFKTKHIDFGPASNTSLLSVIHSCRKNSIPFTILTPNQVSHQFSGVFRLPSDWIGIVTNLGGVIKPTKAVAMLQTLASKNGAVLMDNAEVTKIEKKSDEIVVTTAAGVEFRSRKCVITAGPWTRKLIEKVRGMVLPIQPLEAAVHYWKIRKGHEGKFTINGGFPTFACYGNPYIYGTPSLEFPGLIKVPIHGGRRYEVSDRSWTTDTEAVEKLRKWIEEGLGGLVETEKPVMVQWCMYSMTPDEDYVIDFVGGEFGKDVVVCGGFSGHGFKMGTVVGKIAAEMVMKGTVEVEGVEMTHFRVGRFEGGKGKGNVKEFDEQVKSSKL